MAPRVGDYVAAVAADTDDTVRLDPVAMRQAAQAVNDGAEVLRNRLAALDREVAVLLGDWRGASGGAYAAVWEQWHRGADEVQAGLSILARGLAEAERGYRLNETRSARALREVVDGAIGGVVSDG